MDSIRTLVAWAESKGGQVNPGIEVCEEPAEGIYLRAKPERSLPPQSPIVSCPFGITLSYFNALNIFPALPSRSPSSVPSYFPREILALAESGDVHIVGHFFLMLQYMLGKESFWCAYVESLPQSDGSGTLETPLLYDEHDRKWLEGTQVGAALVIREEQLKRELEIGGRIMDEAAGWEMFKGKWSWELYKWAASIFGSRSFISTLLPDQCFEGSIDQETAHTLFVGGKQKATSLRMGTIPVLFPLIDLANHVPTAKVTWFSNVQSDPINMSLRTETGIQAGKQAYNNYAPKGNSQLLLGYGFLIQGNDDLSLAPKALTGDALDIWRAWLGKESKGIPTVPSFTVRTKPYTFEEDGRLSAFDIFENGCIDHMALLLANNRERQYILSHATERPETHARQWIAKGMGRVVFAVAGTLQQMLQLMADRIILTDAGIVSLPVTSMQKTAARYRQGQVQLLNLAISKVSSVLEQVATSGVGALNKLVDLREAYNTAETNLANPKESPLRAVKQTLEIEGEDDESWDEAEEDWWFSMWCFWIYVQLLSPQRNDWVSRMEQFYSSQMQVDDSFCGEQSELEGVVEMVDDFSQYSPFQASSEDERMRRIILAARIVQGETVLCLRAFKDPSRVVPLRRLLCVYGSV